MWDVEVVAFNMPFVSTNSIIARLRATTIHENDRRDIQFVVGVYVHPIVHRVFSVRRVTPYHNSGRTYIPL